MDQLAHLHQEDSLTDLYSSPPKHSKNGSGRWEKIAITAAGVLTLGAAVFAGVSYYQQQEKAENDANLLQADTYYTGTMVERVDLGGKTKERAQRALEAVEPGLLPRIDIKLTYGDKDWTLAAQDLGYSLSMQEALDEAYDYARTGNNEERLKLIEELKTAPKAYSLTATSGEAVLEQKLSETERTVNISPVSATVASFDATIVTFQYKDGKNGLAVESDSLLSQMNALVDDSGTGAVKIPVRTVPFDAIQAHLKSRMQKLGTYTTASTNTADSNRNMRVASTAINGKMTELDAVFSLSNTTGDSNLPENGCRKAAVISGRKKVLKYEGGVCQVSPTLHGAATRSNMETTSRASHIWQLSHVPLGLDAIVSYPYLDLQLKNPTEYPAYVMAGMTGAKVTVMFYDYQSPDYDNIEAALQQTSTVARPEDQFVVDSFLRRGEKALDRKGNAGTRTSAKHIFCLNGKVIKTEAPPSGYYHAIANIYKVGPRTEGTTFSTPAPSAATSSKPASNIPFPSTASSSQVSSSFHTSSQPASSQPNTASSDSSGQTESGQ